MIKSMLEDVFEKIEAAIDLKHIAEVEQLHRDAMHYREVSRIPMNVNYPADDSLVKLPYTEVFNDPEKMLYNELVSIRNNVWNSVRIQDDYPLQIRPNYGIGIISSLFGAGVSVRDNAMPWVIPLPDENAFAKAVSHGIPDLKSELTERVLEAYEVFDAWLNKYPKCRQAIHVTQPDMQGPFDNLDLLRGSDIFYDLYDDPALVHQALQVISDTMVAYQKSLPILNDQLGDNCYVIHFAAYSGSILLKLDTETAMISEKMFEEFCMPYNQRVLNAMGGGSIHFCGGGKEWPARHMPRHNISCLNFGNPEMQDLFTDWKQAREQKICVVGYGQSRQYPFLLDQLKRGIRTGVTFTAKAENAEEARRVVAEHHRWCAENF